MILEKRKYDEAGDWLHLTKYKSISEESRDFFLQLFAALLITSSFSTLNSLQMTVHIPPNL